MPKILDGKITPASLKQKLFRLSSLLDKVTQDKPTEDIPELILAWDQENVFV